MKAIYFSISLLLSLYGCSSKHSQENTNAEIPDSLKRRSAFNTVEELYIVYKIGQDTLDPSGIRCKNVEMKSSSGRIFISCYQENIPEIGDSVWIGYDTTGMPYIVEYH